MENKSLITISASYGKEYYPDQTGRVFQNKLQYGYDGYLLDRLDVSLHFENGRDVQTLLDDLDGFRVFLEIHKKCLQSLGELKSEFSRAKPADTNMDTIQKNMKEWKKEMESQPLKIFKKADRDECMRFASKIPYSCVQELIDNTERIRKYLEERI